MQGSHLYAEVESYAWTVDTILKKAFPTDTFQITGSFRRQLEIIEKLEWVTTVPLEQLTFYFEKNNYEVE
jgi:DNA polymerase (family 10)